MNQIIAPKAINFNELVKNSNTTLSLNLETKMINILNTEFTEEEQQWYIANLYIYMNYHPTNDYPINLEHVFKMIGFANKENAKRTLKNNFTKDEDYKTVLVRTDENLNGKDLGGRPTENVMLNVDTFKNLCMLAKTDKGKQIRKYYVKLENIYNQIIKEEIESKDKLLEEKEQLLIEQETQLQEKEETIKQLENKPETYGFERVPGYIYFVEDTTKPGHIKLGYATTPNDRVSSLNVSSSTYSLKNLVTFETFDKEFAEKIVHYSLNPFRIKNRKEWFYFKNQNEMVYALNTIKSCIEFIKKFDIIKIKEKGTINLQEFLIELNKENIEKAKQVKELQKDKRKIINKTNAEKGKHRSGNFKGTTFTKDKQLWKAEVQHNNKRVFLGYFTDEIDAAKVYNDYILFLNENENTNFLLNEIPGYVTVPRNIPEENKRQITEKQTSEYTGVSYDSKRKYYVAGIGLSGKTYNLGNSQEEVECAKLYNQQALFFNNTFNTKYTLNDIENYTTLPKDFRNQIVQNKINKKSSEFHGVSITTTKKWAASYMLNRKKIHIGTFNTELEACKAYNKVVIQLNENGCNYKINKTSP
jgi:phage anti-repressor protein